VDLLGTLRVLIRREEVQVSLIGVESLLPGARFLIDFAEAEIGGSVVRFRLGGFFEAAKGALVILPSQIKIANLYGFRGPGRRIGKIID
jgi:hypothetical protein